MKNIIIATFLLLTYSTMAQNNELPQRFIEVKGSAEMEITPDEISFIIEIQEYWKEEFQKRKDYKDYKTKVPISEIEDALIKDLRNVGINKKDVVVKRMGNYWRQQGKEFLYSKQFEFKIKDLSKINELTQITNAKGIKRMNIGKLDHSQIQEYKKQVKINALKAAREKARYLVESIGNELGDVISISELSDSYVRPPMYANTRMMTADVSNESIDQVQNINLNYQVNARFAIK